MAIIRIIDWELFNSNSQIFLCEFNPTFTGLSLNEAAKETGYKSRFSIYDKIKRKKISYFSVNGHKFVYDFQVAQTKMGLFNKGKKGKERILTADVWTIASMDFPNYTNILYSERMLTAYTRIFKGQFLLSSFQVDYNYLCTISQAFRNAKVEIFISSKQYVITNNYQDNNKVKAFIFTQGKPYQTKEYSIIEFGEKKEEFLGSLKTSNCVIFQY